MGGINIYQLGRDARHEAGEGVNDDQYYQPLWQYKAVNSGKDELLAELLKLFERYRTFLSTSSTPTDIDITTNVDTYPLPVNMVRLSLVQVKIGNDYYIIEEHKKTEALAGMQYPGTARGLHEGNVYELIGDKMIIISPPPTTSKLAGLRIWYEHDIPDLLVGNPSAGGPSTITLPATYNEPIGQRAAEPLDDLYNGMELEIIDGPGQGERKRISDYVGSSRIATVDSAWSAQPTAASKFAMILPLPRMCDRIIRYWAAAEMLANGGETATVAFAMYERAMQSWMEVLDQPTPGTRAMVPFDLAGDSV